MDPEQHEEWLALQEAGIARVRQGSVRRALFQVVVLPAFSPAESWEIERSGDTRCAFAAARTVWRSDLDAAKLATPVIRLRYPRALTPTIEVSRAEVDGDWVRERLAEIQAIRVPPWV